MGEDWKARCFFNDMKSVANWWKAVNEMG